MCGSCRSGSFSMLTKGMKGWCGMTAFDLMNSVYQRLCQTSAALRQMLTAEGFRHTHGFYNNHSVKRGGVFVTEHYPIPVISVDGIGDIGIDIENIWFEAALPREKALQFDYRQVAGMQFELYGAVHFLDDLCDGNAPADQIVECIKESGEEKFCMLFTFGESVDLSALTALVRLFDQ